ncbi:MAG: transposase, partial [Streptosporangiaceae bacterium]
MSRYRLNPTPAQEAVLRDHCGHARYTWNLAVEQHSHWHPGRASAPGYLEQCRQLTQARAGRPWLAAGSQTVQQQALRDFTQAMTAFFGPKNAAGRPSCAKPAGTRDSGSSAAGGSGTWAACPATSARSGCPRPGGSGSAGPVTRRLQRKLARATRGSNRRGRVKHGIARLKAREADRRKDWAEQVSTVIARRFDLIRVEDLQVATMTRAAKGTRENPGRNVRAKAGLNRGILASGWGLLVRRLEDKAPGRVEKISPAFTSQRCSACGRVDRGSRESQAVFRCTA